MEELLDYINGNDDLTVSKPLPHVTTVKWQAGWVGFYLHISKEELGYYRCIGAIVISRYNIDRMDSSVMVRDVFLITYSSTSSNKVFSTMLLISIFNPLVPFLIGKLYSLV